MNNLQKWGGAAALYEGLAYIVGMIGFILVLNADESANSQQAVATMLENRIPLTTLHLIVYVAWGAILVVLTLALYERLNGRTSAVARTATAFGLIWAVLVIASGMIYNIGLEAAASLYANDPIQATTVWLAVETICNGIGGGVEVVGGIWVVLLSIAALRHGGLPRAFSYFGLLVGTAGLVTVIPALGEIGGITFGLTQIVWFLWLGIAMLRQPSAVSQTTALAFD